ncbi:MAG: 4'-phosphopantetheinyl transferase superfamily protein [Bacilli bacterium]|nr:4'-phosphopantetheinyl transferase superfamily protein [Bacilli bacterium]
MKIYYAKITPLLKEKKYQHYYQQLPRARQKRADAYLKPIDQIRSVAAFTLLLKLLDDQKITYHDQDFRVDRNGKPYLAGQKIYFNLAHGGDYVIAAISEEKIGVDVESTKREEEIDKLTSYVFNRAEQNGYQQSHHRSMFFYRIWTLKESYIKCVGKGLQIKMPTINLRSQLLKNYLFQSFIHAHHQFAICSYQKPINKAKEIKL